MSAEQIIAEIERLPEAERDELFAYIRSREAVVRSPSEAVSPEFQRIADKVFSGNKELFRKLAQ